MGWNTSKTVTKDYGDGRKAILRPITGLDFMKYAKVPLSVFTSGDDERGPAMKGHIDSLGADEYCQMIEDVVTAGMVSPEIVPAEEFTGLEDDQTTLENMGDLIMRVFADVMEISNLSGKGVAEAQDFPGQPTVGDGGSNLPGVSGDAEPVSGDVEG